MLPRFEIVRRARPVDLVAPRFVAVESEGDVQAPLPQPAPYVAIEATVSGSASLVLESEGHTLRASYDADGGRAWLTVDGREHRSRRFGRVEGPVDGLALVLSGWQVAALTRLGRGWTARARHDLTGTLATHDEAFCAALHVRTEGVARVRGGGYGQVGLRDQRFVTTADGDPVRLPDGRLALSASHAGLGFFGTGHTGLWALDPDSLSLEHLSDLFFRRPGERGAWGDHATHVVRHHDRWLVATSTWGDFDRTPGRLRAVLAETGADVLRGRHVLDTRELVIPTGPARSVGVWDPHLVRADGEWLVGFVSATRFFRFHPGLAVGPTLDNLSFRAAAPDRIATEGSTLVRLEEGMRLLASDGRDGRRGQRAGFPVFDLDLRQVGTLDAPYPSNLPWPTITRLADGSWLMVTFNGSRWGGGLLDYGTHGQVVFLRAAATSAEEEPRPAQSRRGSA